MGDEIMISLNDQGVGNPDVVPARYGRRACN